MAKALRNLSVKIGADTAVFERKMKGARKQVSSFGSSVKQIGGMLAGAFGAYKLIGFARDSIEAFFRQERAINQLGAALELAGVKGRKATREMEEFAAEIQKQTTIGDEAAIEIMTLGASIGKLTGEQLKRATIAAIGLSKAFGMDLNAAMRLVARAAVGDTATLKRYGIVLDTTKDKQGQFNDLLEIGASKFRLATAETETAAGRVEQLANKWGDAKEKIGAAIGWIIQEWDRMIQHMLDTDIEGGAGLDPKIKGMFGGLFAIGELLLSKEAEQRSTKDIERIAKQDAANRDAWRKMFSGADKQAQLASVENYISQMKKAQAELQKIASRPGLKREAQDKAFAQISRIQANIEAFSGLAASLRPVADALSRTRQAYAELDAEATKYLNTMEQMTPIEKRLADLRREADMIGMSAAERAEAEVLAAGATLEEAAAVKRLTQQLEDAKGVKDDMQPETAPGDLRRRVGDFEQILSSRVDIAGLSDMGDEQVDELKKANAILAQIRDGGGGVLA